MAHDDIFSIERERPSGRLQTFFFKTWAGYTHPVHLSGPISYNNAVRSQSYYEASFSGSGEPPLLIYVQKFVLNRMPIEVDVEVKSGQHFFIAVKHDGGSVAIARKVPIENTIDLKDFIFVSASESGILLKEFVVRRTMLSYEYEYAGQKLVKATVVSASGTKILTL